MVWAKIRISFLRLEVYISRIIDLGNNSGSLGCLSCTNLSYISDWLSDDE